MIAGQSMANALLGTISERGRNVAKLSVVPSALSDSTSCGSVSPRRRLQHG
jgi:hypothetical protein